MRRNKSTLKKSDALVCSICGNKERFIEVMAVETHLVNGQRDYIRLLEGIAENYHCWYCGATIEGATMNRA